LEPQAEKKLQICNFKSFEPACVPVFPLL